MLQVNFSTDLTSHRKFIFLLLSFVYNFFHFQPLSKILVTLEFVEMLEVIITKCPLGEIKSKETAGAATKIDPQLEATKITK